MPRPVDNASSTDIRQAVALIDKAAARRGAAARAATSAGMKPAKAEYDAKLRALRAVEHEELKKIERWHVAAVAKIEGRPIQLADVRSVKRESVVQASNGVSLPRLSCLERRS